MAFKAFPVEGLPPVKVYKRRGSRAVRLSIGAEGDVRVTIPVWAAYAVGVGFAEQKRHWILSRLPSAGQLNHGMRIGKAHSLAFVPAASAAKVSASVRGSTVTVTHPARWETGHEQIQAAAKSAALRALRQQADSLLPRRLEQLAHQHGYSYTSIRSRRLKSRWGSCDSNRRITLNIFLMQLPWECIDYVLLHELAHTRVLQHGPAFWQEMERVLPDARQRRKQLRAYQPLLRPEPATVA